MSTDTNDAGETVATDTRLTVVEQRLDVLNDVIDRLEKETADLERENAELRRQVAELKAQVDPDPGSKEYADLSRAEKVRRVREQLVDVAETNHNGKASMKYKEIMMLFGGNPSPGHCYDLMERAGELDGFGYDTNGEGQKRIRVDVDAVKDESLFHTANKAVEA